MLSPDKKTLAVCTTCFLWAVALVAGFGALFRYETAPGQAGIQLPRWPEQSSLERSSDTATLVMLAHPKCPCTRSSIAELAQIMTRVNGKARAYVLFAMPEGFQEEWAHSGLWKAAAAIPGVTVRCDTEGREAKRFGVETSGHTLLFDAAGNLLFGGGITASRGHAGENPGRTAIVSYLTSASAAHSRTSVFGCPLFDPQHLLCRRS